MDSEEVRELPLNGRNFLQLALLSGGVNEVSPVSTVFTSNVGPPGRLVVLPGAFPYSVGYSLNGFNVRSRGMASSRSVLRWRLSINSKSKWVS